jgi:hypothetical protein
MKRSIMSMLVLALYSNCMFGMEPRKRRCEPEGSDSSRYSQKCRRYDHADRRDLMRRESSGRPISCVRLIVNGHDDDAHMRQEQLNVLLERTAGVLRLLQETVRELTRTTQKIREEHAVSMKKLLEQQEKQARLLELLVGLKEKQCQEAAYDEQKSQEKIASMYS